MRPLFTQNPPMTSPPLRAKVKVPAMAWRPDVTWRPATPLISAPATASPLVLECMESASEPDLAFATSSARDALPPGIYMLWPLSLHLCSNSFCYQRTCHGPSLTILPKRMVTFILIRCPPWAYHHPMNFVLAFLASPPNWSATLRHLICLSVYWCKNVSPPPATQ